MGSRGSWHGQWKGEEGEERGDLITESREILEKREGLRG